MASQIGLVEERVQTTITDVLARRMGAFGFRGANVHAGLDHDGEPVLFIEAEYDLVEEPIDPGVTVGLIGDLRNALDQIGESRFPHVRHMFSDEQRFSERRRRKSA
jgi:hypothetical protein